MTYAALRQKHPEFVYERFKIERFNTSSQDNFRITERDNSRSRIESGMTDNNKQLKKLRLTFYFTLKPDIHFTPTLILPLPPDFSDFSFLENFAFHLGLAEIPSYWKAACPPLITIKAGFLDQTQINWWQDLLINGLGEFLYTNKIDIRDKNLVKIKVKDQNNFKPSLFNKYNSSRLRSNSKALFLVGGGKESAVGLEILTQNHFPLQTLVLNPITSATKISRIASFEPLIAERQIDPLLLELNQRGYLNGHTPFSSYLAFLGMMVAAMNKRKQVIVANERSANEGNIQYLGRTINHQYSKTFEFEQKFRDYSRRYLTPAIEYFSLLRPWYELQIAKILAGFPKYHQAFKSCNVNQKLGTWCGRCAKCLFAYATLYPFLSQEEIVAMFHKDLYADLSLWPQALALVGKDSAKPFDCVGTKEESLVAFYLGAKKVKEEDLTLPPLLARIDREILRGEKDLRARSEKILSGWNNKHFVPEELTELLKKEIND